MLLFYLFSYLLEAQDLNLNYRLPSAVLPGYAWPLLGVAIGLFLLFQTLRYCHRFKRKADKSLREVRP